MTQLLPLKNVVPIMQYNYQLTNSSNFGEFAPGQRQDITSGTFQLNQLPSKFIIVVRKQLNQMSSTDSDSFFTISGVSINMSTASEILSSCTQQDLYCMSVRNGYSGSFLEFSGKACQSTLNTITSNIVKTTGSILVINTAIDLSLGSVNITNNSIGQFTFQIKISCTNNYEEYLSPEIMIISCNQGLLTNQLGVSSLATGLLTPGIVMDTIAKGVKRSPDMDIQLGSGFEASVSGGSFGASISGGGLSAPPRKGNLKKYI